MAIGFDCGTYNLVSCKRNNSGDLVYKREVNAFIQIPLDNDFVFNMMKKSGVPLILREDQNVAYALGEAAVNMAYAMANTELRRPMKDGCVNPKEKDAFQIMSIMMHSILDNVTKNEELVYFSVPANAINSQTDAEYHGKILEAIFKAYKNDKEFTVKARPINEALALVYAELEDTAFTGIGISFGAGMVNLCFSVFGNPVFSFAIVNSGDWIDAQAAKATGEPIAVINKRKHKIDLSEEPKDMIDRAIQTQYRLMIEKTVGGIKQGLQKHEKARLDSPVKIVVAGGTASPNGFEQFFKQVIDETTDLGVEVGEVVKPADPIKSVARGCLIAAENAS